jgi:hypothetical protein
MRKWIGAAAGLSPRELWTDIAVRPREARSPTARGRPVLLTVARKVGSVALFSVGLGYSVWARDGSFAVLWLVLAPAMLGDPSPDTGEL